MVSSVYVYLCLRACMHAMCMCVHVCVHCVYVCVYTCVCACVHACINVCMCNIKLQCLTHEQNSHIKWIMLFMYVYVIMYLCQCGHGGFLTELKASIM